MSRVDRYIARATTGLPRSERLEAAAELRTHLIERVAQLREQGLAREEAEHVALRELGSPHRTNRGLLGHVFTNRLGWAALVTLLLLMAAWLLGDRLLRPLAVTQVRVADAVGQGLRNPSGLLLGLPRDVGSVYLGVRHAGGGGYRLVMDPELDGGAYPPLRPLRSRLEVVAGELRRPDPGCAARAEPALSLLLLAGPRGGTMQERVACVPAPGGYLRGRWEALAPAVVGDLWLPVAVFVPTVAERRSNPVDPGDRYAVERIAPEEGWAVLSLWVGVDAAEPDPAAQPPGIAWLRDIHPGLFLELDEQEGRR